MSHSQAYYSRAAAIKYLINSGTIKTFGDLTTYFLNNPLFLNPDEAKLLRMKMCDYLRDVRDRAYQERQDKISMREIFRKSKRQLYEKPLDEYQQEAPQWCKMGPGVYQMKLPEWLEGARIRGVKLRVHRSIVDKRSTEEMVAKTTGKIGVKYRIFWEHTVRGLTPASSTACFYDTLEEAVQVAQGMVEQEVSPKGMALHIFKTVAIVRPKPRVQTTVEYLDPSKRVKK